MIARNPLANTPPVIKNLVLINIVFFVASWTLPKAFNIDLTAYLALYHPSSPYFKPVQFVTHMFMHASFWHIFFNMYVLWSFGRILEMAWGGKRFLLYYFITGIGAAVLHLLVTGYEIAQLQEGVTAYLNSPGPEAFGQFVNNYLPSASRHVADFSSSWGLDPQNRSYYVEAEAFVLDALNHSRDVPTVGASGAVYGVLLAFGMLFPNTVLMLIFPIPLRIKAKYLVLILGGMELLLGLSNSGADNIAHFAHLGGMLFGFFLVRFWRRSTTKWH